MINESISNAGEKKIDRATPNENGENEIAKESTSQRKKGKIKRK